MPAAPGNLECSALEGDVFLSWDNPEVYDAIAVARDGVELAVLDGEAVTWSDTLVAPGVYQYTVTGRVGEDVSDPSEPCGVESDIVAPPELSCTPQGSRVLLSWTAPVAYQEIHVARNGESLAVLDGSATSYEDAPGQGVYTYEVQAWYDETLNASAACEVEARGVYFVRGDTNASGRIDLADVIFILGYLFRRDRAPTCFDAADVNGDGAIDVSDAIYMLNFIFNRMAPPPAPYPECGAVVPGQSLGCEAFLSCE